MSDNRINNMGNYLTINTGMALQPINISIDNFGRLEPKEDITPLEAVHISMLLCGASLLWADLRGFITKHKLERHFTNE